MVRGFLARLALQALQALALLKRGKQTDSLCSVLVSAMSPELRATMAYRVVGWNSRLIIPFRAPPPPSPTSSSALSLIPRPAGGGAWLRHPRPRRRHWRAMAGIGLLPATLLAADKLSKIRIRVLGNRELRY